MFAVRVPARNRACSFILTLLVIVSAAPAIGQQPNAELLKVLKDWETASRQVNSLSGNHHRIVYDLVFDVEKHADGRFYYEAPDKGRIDIEPTKIPAGQLGQRLNPKTGKRFSVKGELAEKWICDGKRIIQLNEQARTAEEIQIPAESQGENIMNGPLPFLFGMPADVALGRYELALVPGKNSAKSVMLEVKPKLQRDAANWKQAKVILSKPAYLPAAVQLVDPTGNAETVYTFSAMKVNRRTIPFIGGLWRKWYEPNLATYNVTTRTIPENSPEKPAPTQTATIPAGHAKLPSLIGFHYKDADELLKKLKFNVKYLRGTAASDKKFQYRVYQQDPAPGEIIKHGQTIELTLYDKFVTKDASAPNAAPR